MLLGFALVCIALATIALIVGVRQAFAEVPDEDRSFLDQPPPAYRSFWPLVQLLSFRAGSVLPINYRHRTQQLLRYAGLDYSLSPEQFFAGKILCALAAMLVLALATWPSGLPSWLWFVLVAAGGFFYPDLWLRDQRKNRQGKILKALPFYLDVITLCVESGLNLTGAMSQAVAKAPPNPLRDELNRVLRDIRTGKSRSEALRAFAERMQMPAISNVVSALLTADKQGAALGPILRAQAEQRRSERFQRAEKLAMEAPVKMLFPLIAFIFPCTFAVIAFPIVIKFMEQGFFR
jgi:tight adherence protein C